MNGPDRFSLLLEKYLDRALAPEERRELKERLAADPALRAQFVESVTQEAALRALHARAARVPSLRKPALAAAAALLVALASYLLLRPSEPPVATLDVAGRSLPLRAGEVVREGSIRFEGEPTRIHVRSGAEVRLRTQEGAKRVDLERGEIEASVAPQPRPMVLSTPHAEAVVLGTRFRLSASPEGTRLDVSEGRIRFTRREDGASLEVTPGRPALAAGREGYQHRFLALWRELHEPSRGYFSPDGVPYHAVETLIVDGPDHGHQTTSETFSYWLWLEAMYGGVTGDWAPLRRAWSKMEEAIVPRDAQPGYRPEKPSAYVPELDRPEDYPAAPDASAPVGRDPLAGELRAAYGTGDLYATHWLFDVDNFYGFGRLAPINTFQRGPEESVWETVPHPSRERFRWGGKHGYLDLFVKEGGYAPQWRYTCAPDADARAIQALYWAAAWAKEKRSDLPLAQAARMGDSLRYALYDKYFRSRHDLLAWYFAWGGAEDGAWAWRSGSSHVHFGYQNPVAAWALSREPALRPASSGGAADWERSLRRQVEFYRWLQSADGAIAGGATTSWKGRYETPPAGTSTFYGLAYVEHPVFHDPPSNAWFGWQAWSMERLAEYAYLSRDPLAAEVVEKWAAWIRGVVRLEPDGGYGVPSTLRWTGRPDPWDAARPGPNAGLRVEVTSTSPEVGLAASVARALLYHAAATRNAESRKLARELLDRMWLLYRNERGLSAPEAREDYARFFSQKVPLPAGWSGTMPNGDAVRPGASFLDIRSNYRRDPQFAAVEEARRKGEAPVFRYHRFWAQVEVALANAEYARLR